MPTKIAVSIVLTPRPRSFGGESSATSGMNDWLVEPQMPMTNPAPAAVASVGATAATSSATMQAQCCRRISLRLSMPATSVFERALRPVDGKSGVPVDFARRPLWLVRGVDRSGRNDFSIGHR